MKRTPWLRWKEDDNAVSPVIAVILMVAITVVLAAVVYTWASGLAGQQGSGARTVQCSSASNNKIRIVNDPNKNVAYGTATYKAEGTDAVFTGATDTSQDFRVNWIESSGTNIGVGDVAKIDNQPSSWSSGDTFTFRVQDGQDIVIGCEFTFT